MENAEEIMHSLEEFSKLKPKDIPRELEEYLGYVAKTGDPVFKWSIIKCLFREKLLNVITDFHESTHAIELPPCPNVDPFNYERMKANLLEKLDSFSGAPFTVQRISELLTNPWKEYNRADKFMRAIEKNILVVSTREPGRYADNDTDSQQDTSFNGIPGPNDSGIETSFSCNDLADADSSSQQCDLSQDSKSNNLIPGVDSSSITSVTFKDNEASIGDSASPNEIGIIRNDQVSQEIIIEEKDTETVICSTVATDNIEEIQQEEICDKEANVSVSSVTEIIVSEDGIVDSNTPDSVVNDTKDIIVETKEVVIEDVTSLAVVSNIEIETEEEPKSTVVEVDSSTDCVTKEQPSQEPRGTTEEISEETREEERVSSCESSEMEGECQVSDVDQSQL